MTRRVVFLRRETRADGNPRFRIELTRDAGFPNDLIQAIVSDPTQINDLFLTTEQKEIALRGYSGYCACARTNFPEDPDDPCPA
jgi:hypothetical protein